MGASKSKANSSQEITNTTLNQNLMDTLNKNIMNTSVETLVKSASACSSSVDQTNQCKVSNSTFDGDFNINATQANIAKVNFACIQAAQARADMSNAMSQSMIAQMKSLNGTDGAAALNAAVAASNQTGSLSTGGGSTSTKNKGKVETNVTNETISRVENIFEQNLANNFTQDTVNQCIGKTNQNNVVDVEGVKVGGNANIGCTQTNSIEVVQECKQLSEAINKITQDTANELGFVIEGESSTTSVDTVTATTKSDNVTTGVLQDAGTAIADIITSAGAFFNTPFFYIIGIILVLVFLGYIYFKYGGGSSAGAAGMEDMVQKSANGWANRQAAINATQPSVVQAVPLSSPQSLPAFPESNTERGWTTGRT